MNKFNLIKYGIVLFVTGFAALVYEIVFIKTLSLFMGQSIYAFSVMLAAFMFGIGIGSFIAPRLKGEMMWYFALTQFGIAAYSIIYIPLLNNLSIPAFLAAKQPFFLHNLALIFTALLMLIIPTTLMGVSFPALLSHVMSKSEDKNHIGRLFAFNTIGGLFGSLAAGFIFLPELGVTATLTLAAVLNLAVGSSIKTKLRGKRITAGVILLIIMFSTNSDIDPHVVGSFYNTSLHEDIESFTLNINESRKSSEIIYTDFNEYGHVFVKKVGAHKFLYLNGKPDAGTSDDIVTQLLIGYIPMFLHANAKNIAVVGLGSGITAGAALNFDVDRVDVYEINPGVVEANKYFAEENRNALVNPKTNLVMGDARRNLHLSDESYDIIISEPSNPWIEGEGFLFTKEYYEIVDERLNEDGIFVQWLGAYDYSEEDFNVLLNTLYTIFPHIQIWSEGTDFYIITSKDDKKFNYTETISKMNNPAVKEDINKLGIISKRAIEPIDIFFSFFVAHYKPTGETKINTDDNSIIEFSTARHPGQKRDHLERFGTNNLKELPVTLTKNDLDVEIYTDLPYYGSKYFVRSSGGYVAISREMAFKDDVKTLFVRTQLQEDAPTRAQAEKLAREFRGSLIEEGDYMFNFKGETSNGFIDYCPEVKQFFLVYKTYLDPVVITCK